MTEAINGLNQATNFSLDFQQAMRERTLQQAADPQQFVQELVDKYEGHPIHDKAAGEPPKMQFPDQSTAEWVEGEGFRLG